MIVLLQGPSGVGKSTLINRITKDFATRRLKGFVTRELRDENRQGFKMVDLKNPDHEVIIARIKDPKDDQQIIGRYKVYPNKIGEFVRKIDIEQNDTVVIDEIGKMQNMSTDFKIFVRNAIEKSKVMLATIPIETEGINIAKELESDETSILINVDRYNRDILKLVVPSIIEKAYIYNEFTDNKKRIFSKFVKNIVSQGLPINKISILVNQQLFLLK